MTLISQVQILLLWQKNLIFNYHTNQQSFNKIRNESVVTVPCYPTDNLIQQHIRSACKIVYVIQSKVRLFCRTKVILYLIL